MQIFIDGACQNNGTTNAKAGVGVVICHQQVQLKIAKPFHHDRNPTNQRAEIYAAIVALTAVNNLPDISASHAVEIYSDSQYVIKTMHGEFKRKTNLDLWDALDQASHDRPITWNWVRGHSGHALQELADNLAVQAALGQTLNELPAPATLPRPRQHEIIFTRFADEDTHTLGDECYTLSADRRHHKDGFRVIRTCFDGNAFNWDERYLFYPTLDQFYADFISQDFSAGEAAF